MTRALVALLLLCLAACVSLGYQPPPGADAEPVRGGPGGGGAGGSM